jgi:hypothetical protein
VEKGLRLNVSQSYSELNTLPTERLDVMKSANSFPMMNYHYTKETENDTKSIDSILQELQTSLKQYTDNKSISGESFELEQERIIRNTSNEAIARYIIYENDKENLI